MLKAIVVDDEKPSREVICNYLRDYCEDIQVITTASSVKSAFKAIKKFQPGLVFLDIEMGDGKGFDLLSMFPEINFKIIFVTAYSEYAIKAFRVNAIDYLLKPVSIDELKVAVEKVKSYNNFKTYSEHIAALIKIFSDSKPLQKAITIPHLKGFEVLKVDEIIMCKADGYCTEFYLIGKRKVLSTKNLKKYEEFLREDNFIRVHHSFMVNLNHVSGYSRQGEIILTEGNRADLGDSYKEDFIKCFGKR
jgi:two-component system, LytTR family, response regulator